ncbi:MAG: hypothetical protein ACLQUR_05600 [Limisphaerales bacterium]
MSKQSTSRLTPSRKNRRRRTARPGLAWLDAMLHHCRVIGTLSGLLLHGDEDGLSAELVGDTGALIEREAKQLRKLLLELERKAAR